MGANGKKYVQSVFKVFPFLPFCLSNSRTSLIFRGEKEGRGEMRIAKMRGENMIWERGKEEEWECGKTGGEGEGKRGGKKFEEWELESNIEEKKEKSMYLLFIWPGT
jgi:hypothetical protein